MKLDYIHEVLNLNSLRYKYKMLRLTLVVPNFTSCVYQQYIHGLLSCESIDYLNIKQYCV